MLMVIFVVLMIFWFLGGGYWAWNGPTPNPPLFFTNTLIPWACVAILGWTVFGGSGVVIR